MEVVGIHIKMSVASSVWLGEHAVTVNVFCASKCVVVAYGKLCMLCGCRELGLFHWFTRTNVLQCITPGGHKLK